MGGPEKPSGKSIRKSLSEMCLADFADFLWSSYSFEISTQSSQTINLHEFITIDYSLFQTFCKWDLHPTSAANMYQTVSSSKFIYLCSHISSFSICHHHMVSFGTVLTEVHADLLLTHSLTLAPFSSFVLISVPSSKFFFLMSAIRVLWAEPEILEMFHPYNARWSCLVEAKSLQSQIDDSHNSG